MYNHRFTDPTKIDNMKKFTTFMKPVLLGLLAVLLVTCGKKSGDYRNLIPRSAFLTMSINAGSMMEKAGLSQAERSAYRTQAELMLGFMGGSLSADDKQFLLSIIESPDNSGLSITSDIYFFIDMENGGADDPSAGLVAKVGNKKKLDQLVGIITSLSPTITTRSDRGLDIVVLDQSSHNTAVLAYDDNSCIFYRTGNDYAGTIREVAELYDGSDLSLASDKTFDPFFTGKSDFGMLMSYGNMMKIAQQQGGAVPFADMVSGATMYMKTDFKKGVIDTDYGILFDNDEAKKKYEEFYRHHEITGKFAHLIPDNVLAAATGYLDGDQIYSALMKIPDLTPYAVIPQFKTIMGALEGDLLFAFTGMDPLRNDYRGILAVTVNDPGVVDYIVGQLGGFVDIRTEGENGYSVQLQNLGIPLSFQFGTHNDVLYVATDPVMVEALKGKSIDHLKGDIHDKFHDSYGAFYVDINRMVGIVTEIIDGMGYYDTNSGPLLHFFTSFEDLEAWADDPYKGKMVVNMVNKDQNALETIVSFIKDIALSNMGGGMMPF